MTMSKQLSKEQCIGLLLEQDVFVLNRLVQVVDEYERASVLHPHWPINRYLFEENPPLDMEKEAVQTAATALRFLASSPKA